MIEIKQYPDDGEILTFFEFENQPTPVGTYKSNEEEGLIFKKQLEEALPTVKLILKSIKNDYRKERTNHQYYLKNDNFECPIGPGKVTETNQPDEFHSKHMSFIMDKIKERWQNVS